MPTCSIAECERPVLARSWCKLHYERWRKRGTTDPVSWANSGRFTPGQRAHNKGVPATVEAKKKVSESNRGKVAWNKGVPWRESTRAKFIGMKRSDETKAKIREARARQVMTPAHRAAIAAGLKGKPKSPEHIAKLSGAAHYRWKGGTQRSMSKREWRAIRAIVLARDGYECRACGNLNRRSLVVHHVIPVDEGGLDVEENLITWCRRCHVRHHSLRRSHEDLNV